MLKNISPILTADLLWVLAAMGHGDDLAIVDANHPAEKLARLTSSQQLIQMPGLTMAQVIEAILTVYPLDTYVKDPVRRMLVIEDNASIPEVQEEVRKKILSAGMEEKQFIGIERFEFYKQASQAFAIIQVGDVRPYGCFLLRKGVIT
ncbi:RbsD/FucU family protein [Bartonella sp. DGB1]|uniref:RbsD/FucU family protein n=1 Tax=Bartonella sp. DGB1 TaxID=3239807 RepID=UPI003525C128